jgi:hypothetical protein
VLRKQVWEIKNDGKQPHEMVLIKLGEGKTMNDVAAPAPGSTWT